MFYIGFNILICSILFWVTIIGKDIFPFSHYPMFSNLHHVSKVKVFRLALETQNGNIEWWKSEFYREPEFIGAMIKQYYWAMKANKIPKPILLLWRNKLLIKVLYLVKAEHGSIKNYKAFHIIMRTINNMEITNKTIEIISFKTLVNETV